MMNSDKITCPIFLPYYLEDGACFTHVCHPKMTAPVSSDDTPVKTTTPAYFPAPYSSRTMALDAIKVALMGPTKIFPTPCRNTKMAYVANTVEGSSLTALPMATRNVPNLKLKKL